MKRKLCFMALLFLFTSAYSQSQKPPSFNVGDKAPDLMVYNILNHPTGQAQLSSYRGKLLILDFMATWCSLCTSLLPKTDSLQKELGNQVQFLPVTYQSKADVEKFLSRLKSRGNTISLPIAVSDKVLRSLFAHHYIPHYVWIDGEGTIKAITGHEEVTRENLQRLLKTGSLEVKTKNDRTAGQVNAKFINVGLNDILDMWIGNSEKNLHAIFDLARRNAPCVLFIDEIDALGASRSDMKQSSGRHLINQFLQELDGIDNTNEGVLILGATNTPWNLDPAFRRPGRFDRIVFVPPPDDTTRESILKLKLKNKPTAAIDYSQIAKKSEHYSGADIDAIIDIAIELKLEASFADGIPQPIDTKDLLNAVKKHKPSTQEWFMTAKNFAMFANDTGLYDDILNYLKIKK